MTRKIRNSNISTGTITSEAIANTGVTSGDYGSSTAIPVLNINAKGQIVTATTAALPSNLATETYVTNAIAALVDSAPSALDTLNELAAALGDDSNFATTITNSLSTKVDKINITGATVGSATEIPVITYNTQGQITGTTTAALDLSTKVDKINITGATVGATNKIPQITYNAQGQITAVTELTTINATQLNGVASTGYHIVTTNPGTAGNGTLSIGNNGSYSYVQSHSGQPLRLNPVGNALQGPDGSSIWYNGNVGYSQSGNGYVSLPNGLIMQWCVGSAVSSETDTTTSFPTAFPNACLFVTVGTYMPSGDRDGMFQMRYYDRFSVTSRFNQFNSAGGTGYPTVWAIGY
jgi:hypothetical protein